MSTILDPKQPNMLRNLILPSAISLLFIMLSMSSMTAQLHHANQELPCVNKNYNILAHVAVDSTLREPLYTETQLNKVMNKLNEYFEPICVSFSMCEFNVLEDDYSLGRVVNRPIARDEQIQELKNRFSRRRRINVFFLDTIAIDPCGTSTFEGILTERDANIFTERTCIDGISEQVAHHLGHIFGLRNTYDAQTIELVNGSNCATTGDLLCDTPADPFGQTEATPEEIQLIMDGELISSFYNSACEFIYEVRDPNGEYYQPDMGNIMSAYPCKCGFTQDQFRLMVETILKSDIRHF